MYMPSVDIKHTHMYPNYCERGFDSTGEGLGHVQTCTGLK